MDQNCLVLVLLGCTFKKTIVIFEINTLKFLKNKFLTNTVSFGVGSAFSNGTGSAFFELYLWKRAAKPVTCAWWNEWEILRVDSLV